MFRRMVPLTVAVVLVVGCGKKPADSGGDDAGEPSDPNATYTLTFRGFEKGDKTEVVRARDATATTKTAGEIKTQKEEFRHEYTETILDTAPDEPRPTKVSRVYKTAQRADPKGQLKTASYVGKTVTIEKYLKGYKYTADGGSLPPDEQVELGGEFVRARWKLDQWLPKKPVKVGEEWAVDFAAVTALAGRPQTDYDKQKSKITAKLTRAYKKDGRQWGAVEVKSTLVIDAKATNGSPVKGEINSDVTFDIVIDGSARAGSMKITLKGTIDARDETGREAKTTIEGTQDESLTPVK